MWNPVYLTASFPVMKRAEALTGWPRQQTPYNRRRRLRKHTELRELQVEALPARFTANKFNIL